MKSKITFLLTSLLMLLLGVGSSQAEVGDVVSDISQISATKCYTITTTVRGALVANNAGTQGVSSIKHGAANENASTDADAAKWSFLLHDGSYYLYNVKTRMVYGHGGVFTGNLSNGLELKPLTSPTGDHKFKLMQGANTLNNDQTGVFVLNSWSTEDDGNKLAIVEAGDFTAPSLENLSTVTFNYQNENGVTVETETFENCISGATIKSTRTGLWGVTINTPSTVATGEDQTINTGYTLAEGYPLKFGTTQLDAPKYLWKINRNPAKYASANADQQISNTAGRSALDEAHAFCFVGSPLGFQIYNVGSDSPYGPGAGDEVLTMGEQLNAATFVFVKNEDNGQNLLRDINNASGWLNDTGGKMGYWLSSWAFTDAGSSFSFIEWPTQFEVDGLKYVVKGEYSNEVYVTYNADAEPNAAGQNAYTGDIVVPATVTYEGAVFNVTEIGRKAFTHSTVTSIVIGDNVKTTGGDACAYIPTLKSLTIGSGVTTVGQGICYSCPNLKEVTLKTTAAPAGAPYMFTSNPKMHVKASALQSFLNADQWSSYANNYVAETDGYQFDRDEMLAVATLYESYITKFDGKFSDNVACYSEATKAALEAKIAEAKALAEDADIETTTAAVKAMVDSWVVNPLVSGYYTLINDNAKIADNGKPTKAMFANADANQLYWGVYDANDARYVFYVDVKDDGTITMRNPINGLYAGGSTAFCGAASLTTTPEWNIHIANVYKGYGSHYLKAAPVNAPTDYFAWAYCAQGNADGNATGPKIIWAYNGDETSSGNAPYKEWTWQFKSVSEESVNAMIESNYATTIAALEDVTYGTVPNTFTQESAEAYNAAVAAAKAAIDGTAEEKAAALQAWLDAKEGLKTNDFVDGGVYYIVTAGNGPGYSGGPYNYENQKALYNGDTNVGWTTWNKTDKTQMYTFTKADDGNWYVQNLATQTYIMNPATTHGAVEFSDVPTTTQTFTPAILGSSKFAINANAGNGLSYCFSMALGHNGSANESGTLYTWGTTTEAINQYKVNLWYVYPVPQDILDEDKVTPNYYIVAEEPSTPEAGKTYVVKNAYNNLYLNDKGIADKYSRLNNAALWSLEATDQTVDEDVPVYLLKSEKLGGFWQYDDFATLSGEGGLLDGYDVHNYAGLNATMGDAATAQGFTVLPATAYTTPATRSSVGNGQEPKGFVLAAAAPVVHNGSSSFFKLDTQRGTNAALTPYDATVGWLFYEVTPGTDWNEEIALAKTEYALNLDDMTVGNKPGFYNSEKIAAYTGALEAVNALGDESTKVQTRRAIDALAEAYAAALVPNPIVEGYYYVISAGKGTGYYAGNDAPDREYNDEGKYALFNGNGNVGWKSYNSVAPEQMYYFTEDPANPGNWFLKNLGDNTYFNKGTAQYTCNVTTSTEAETSQIFENSYAPGKFTMRYNGNSYVYSLTPSHNGQVGTQGNSEALEGLINIWGTAAEAAKFKMNVYYLQPVSEANLEAAKEKLAEGLEDLIAKIEGEEIEGSDLPGYYSQSNVAALDAAIESAKGLTEASADERLEALANLKAAYNTATTEFNPITEGYYYLVSKYAAYKEANGAPAAMFTAPLDVRESGLSNVRFDTFDENNANYIFKITPKEGVAGGFYVQNAYNDYYLNTGDGNSWYGEVTTCTETAVNAQLFTNYGVGQFFIADETDNRVSRCVRATGVKSGTIYGWTTIADVITEDKIGYNAWELLPVDADKAAELIAAQTETDKVSGEAYTALNTYVGEIQETYDSYVANTELSEELKTALTDAYKSYTDAKGIRNFDIFATAEKYNAIKAALEEAMKAAHDEINGINGIAAGGNAAVTVGNGGITVTASEATTIKVVSASGAVVAVRNLEAGETATISLMPGVYVVNGNKVMVK